MVDPQLAEVIGGLLVSDKVTNGVMLIAAAKLIWHLSKADSHMKETRLMAVRAHKRIDKLMGDDVGVSE